MNEQVNIPIDSPLAPPRAAYPPNTNGGAQQAPPPPDSMAAMDIPIEPPPRREQPAEPPPQPGQAPRQEGGWRNGKCIMTLRKKVQAHGEMIDKIVFREPTGGDIERIGNPVILSIFEANPKPVYDAAIMTQMMSHLAMVPTSTIRTLDARDWQNCALALFNFFVPDQWIS